MTFPLERLVAILGALLEEHDGDYRPAHAEADWTDLEMGRTEVSALVSPPRLNYIYISCPQLQRADNAAV